MRRRTRVWLSITAVVATALSTFAPWAVVHAPLYTTETGYLCSDCVSHRIVVQCFFGTSTSRFCYRKREYIFSSSAARYLYEPSHRHQWLACITLDRNDLNEETRRAETFECANRQPSKFSLYYEGDSEFREFIEKQIHVGKISRARARYLAGVRKIVEPIATDSADLIHMFQQEREASWRAARHE